MNSRVACQKSDLRVRETENLLYAAGRWWESPKISNSLCVQDWRDFSQLLVLLLNVGLQTLPVCLRTVVSGDQK